MKTTYISAATLCAFLGLGLLPLQANAQSNHPRVNEVNRRLSDQNARIRQGVHSGELTHRETEHLRMRDAKIRYQEQRDRIRHGGHLTRHEQVRINHELNHSSKSIYHDKHNDHIR